MNDTFEKWTKDMKIIQREQNAMANTCTEGEMLEFSKN